MDKATLIQKMRSQDVRKLTGPVEHWLTTFSNGFWGLDINHKKDWVSIRRGDIFIFHASAMVHTPDIKAEKGIIAVGICSGTREKANPVWLSELKTNSNKWPYLIDFEEIWWFSKMGGISAEPMSVKKIEFDFQQRLLREIKLIVQRCVSFKDMQENNCAIPAQGTCQRIISNKDKLVDLLADRLMEATPILTAR